MKHPKTGQEIKVPGRDGDGNLLASGWRVSPAGRSFPAGDMILSAEFSPDGKTLAFTNTGYGQHKMTLVDVSSEKEIASFPIERGWSGLAWSPDGKRIYMSGGVSNPAGDLIIFQKWDGKGWAGGRPGLTLRGATKDSTAISALRMAPDGRTLYALNNSDHHLYVIDTYGGRAVARLQVGRHPIAAKLSADGKTLYVANLGSNDVSIVDVSKPESPAIAGLLKTDSHPNDLVLTKDGRLFVPAETRIRWPRSIWLRRNVWRRFIPRSAQNLRREAPLTPSL
jgi:YVTN family beta-propeller protein